MKRMPAYPRIASALAIGSLAIGLIACGAAGESPPRDSASQSIASTTASQPATGTCRAFLVGGPIDLGRQVLRLESSGEDSAEMTDQMVQAYDDVASTITGTGPDVDDFHALMETVNAGEPWEGAMEAFFDTHAEDCGVNIVRH